MNSTNMTAPARHWGVLSALLLGTTLTFGQTATNSTGGNGAPASQQQVVMKLVEAIRSNNYRQALDTLYVVQQELADIQRNNPRVLWDGVTKTYYDKLIAQITNPDHEMSLTFLAFDSGTSPVSTIGRLVPFFQNQKDLRSSVIETRQQQKIDNATGRPLNLTIVYVKNEYSSNAAPMVAQGRRLKEAIFEFGLRDGLVYETSHVSAGDITADASQPSASPEASRASGPATRPTRTASAPKEPTNGTPSSAASDPGSLGDKLAGLFLRLRTLPPAKSSLAELLSMQATGKADEYFEVYLLAVDRQGIATKAGIAAQRFLERKDSVNAAKFYSFALFLETDSNKLFAAAEDINLGSLEKAHSVVEAVYESSKYSSKILANAACLEFCRNAADLLFVTSDFVVSYSSSGVLGAMKDPARDIIVDAFMSRLGVEGLLTKSVGQSGLYERLSKLSGDSDFRAAVMRAVAASGVLIPEEIIKASLDKFNEVAKPPEILF